MKKTIYALLFCHLSVALFAQEIPPQVTEALKKSGLKNPAAARQATPRSGETCLPDSILTFSKTDPAAADSQIVNRVIDEYDANGNRIHSTDEEWDDNLGALVLAYEYNYSYNAQNVLVLEQIKREQNGAFIVATENRYFPTGTSTTRLDSTVRWEADFLTNEFARLEKTQNAYLPDDKVSDVLTSTHDPAFGWMPAGRTEHTYTATGKPKQVAEFSWDNGWTPLSTIDYTYDTNDSLTQSLVTDLVTGLPTTRTTYEYDIPEHLTKATVENWDEAAQEWVFTLYFTNDLDAQGRLERFELYFDLGFFTLGQRLEFHYPGNSDCISYYDSYASLDGTDWFYDGAAYFYYDGSIVSDKPLTVNGLEASVTPNPFSGRLFVDAPAGSLVRIVSPAGKVLIETPAAPGTDGIGTSLLPAGPYFIQIEKDGRKATRLAVKVD